MRRTEGGRGWLAELTTVSRQGRVHLTVSRYPGEALSARRSSILQGLDRFGIGDLWQTQLFRHLRTDLGGIAVDGLPPAEDEIVVTQSVADALDGALEGVGGGQRIRAGRLAIREQDHPVRAAIECLAQHVSCARRSHGHDRDLAAVLVLHLQGHLQGVQILRIEDGGQRGTVDRAIVLHRLAGDVGRVGHLLDQHHAVIRHSILRIACRRRKTEDEGWS